MLCEAIFSVLLNTCLAVWLFAKLTFWPEFQNFSGKKERKKLQQNPAVSEVKILYKTVVKLLKAICFLFCFYSPYVYVYDILFLYFQFAPTYLTNLLLFRMV